MPPPYLTEEQIDLALTCSICKERTIFVEMHCKTSRKDPHPHVRCATCSPKWWAACVKIEVRDRRPLS